MKDDLISSLQNKNLPDSIFKIIREQGFGMNQLSKLPIDYSISSERISELVKKQEEEVKKISEMNNERLSSSPLLNPVKLEKRKTTVPALQQNEDDSFLETLEQNSQSSDDIIHSDEMIDEMGLKLRDSLFNF